MNVSKPLGLLTNYAQEVDIDSEVSAKVSIKAGMLRACMLRALVVPIRN